MLSRSSRRADRRRRSGRLRDDRQLVRAQARMSEPAPRVWVAEPHEAETVAALLVAFRDSLGYEWPSRELVPGRRREAARRPQTEYLLGAPHDDAPPAGVAQLRYRHGSGAPAATACSRTSTSSRGARAQGSGARSCGRPGRAPVSAAAARRARRQRANEAALALYGALGFSAPANTLRRPRPIHAPAPRRPEDG